jgi:hypothetical protein
MEIKIDKKKFSFILPNGYFLKIKTSHQIKTRSKISNSLLTKSHSVRSLLLLWLKILVNNETG